MLCSEVYAPKKQINSLCEKITKINVHVEALPLEDLRERTLWFNKFEPLKRLKHRRKYKNINHNSPPHVLHKYEVNYLRHQVTDYHCVMGNINRANVTTETRNLAYWIYSNKIYSAIAKAYPHLEAECKEQLKRKKYTTPI